MTDSDNTAVEIGQMRIQILNLGEVLVEIREEIKSLANRNDIIVQTKSLADANERNIATLWQRYDTMREGMDREHKEFEAFINQTVGGRKLMMFLASFFSIALSASLGWCLHEIIVADTVNQIQENRIHTLELEKQK